METKNCQNCKQDFNIEPDDFSFYEKMKVPAPTWCPECRFIRRVHWRNHRSLYKRNCALCSKTLISVFKDSPTPVMCAECWNGDTWDQFEYTRDIDLNKPLFNQIWDLTKLQPLVFQNRVGGNIINSDYANSLANSKNIYLSFSVVDSEDILFSENVDSSKNSIDCSSVYYIDRCSWNIDSLENYNCHFMLETSKNVDSSFLYDCSNCSNCCLSSNLRNKSYVFKNQQCTKDEYFTAVKDLKLSSYSGFMNARTLFDHMRKNSISKFSKNINSVNVTGDNIINSKDIFNCFEITDCENISNGHRMLFSKDIKDCNWVLRGEREYETISGSGNSNGEIGCVLCFGSRNIEYSLYCRNCSYCFACVGLKNAQYCILNKQYSKEEYEEIVPKLRQHMLDVPFIDSKGRIYKYGEFFPYEMCPFGYNETMAHDSFPKSKEEIIRSGFNWKEPEQKTYQVTKDNNTLPDNIDDISEDVLKEVIGCPNNGDYMSQCTTAFKITKEELLFYKQNSLPIPRYCPNCRHYQRVKYRNPMKLYKRTCSNGCGREFETSYAPDRPEKVYCEHCYQAEVL